LGVDVPFLVLIALKSWITFAPEHHKLPLWPSKKLEIDSWFVAKEIAAL